MIKVENKKYYVYVDNYIGNVGTGILIDKKRTELRSHFSRLYLEKVLCDVNESNVMKDDYKSSLINLEKYVFDRQKITKGGFLTALWDICDRNKLGIRYDLSKVPVLQGTIEICNFYNINPYRLLTENAEILILNKNIDMPYQNGSYIGITNDSKKRVRIDGDTEAFLTKDYKDEIDKIMPNYIKRNFKK